MVRAAPPYVRAKLLTEKMEHKQAPKRTAAQVREELIAKLIERGRAHRAAARHRS
jgi:hypothetical protein